MHRHEQLPNKPLVEAILEIRWRLQPNADSTAHDPYYKLLIGLLYNRLRDAYPIHESLPASQLPDEVAAFMVQHRFRESKEGWPLVQVGPGVLTLNSTHDYTWDQFRPRAVQVFDDLFSCYPGGGPSISMLMLRHVDAVQHDYNKASAFDFFRDKLKLNITLPPDLFGGPSGLSPEPRTASIDFSFQSTKPRGALKVRFGMGQLNQAPAILWETTLMSSDGEIPVMPTGFKEWLDDAHATTGDWFFKLIDGDLLDQFRRVRS